MLHEILTAQSRDNVPRVEVDHDNATAPDNSTVELVSRSRTHGPNESRDSEIMPRLGMCACCLAYLPPTTSICPECE